MPLIPFIITLTLPIVSIILTEFILSSKNRTKNDNLKKILFWVIAFFMVIPIYFASMFVFWVPLPLYLIVAIALLLVIPARIIFELVLIGLQIEKNITSDKNRSITNNYRYNYSSNRQNND